MAAVEIAKEALLDEVRKFRDGTVDIDAVTNAAEHVIETARAPAQDLPNDAAGLVYPFVEALVIIAAYFFGSILYCIKHVQNYKNKYQGNSKWDMTFFVVVTTLTIGYGDIYPATIGAQINTILLVLLGGILVSHLGNIVIETCKSWLKKIFFPTMIGWKKEAMLNLFSLVAAGLCIVIGMVGIFLTEHKNIEDPKMTLFFAFYLSVISLATVGYGDFNFRKRDGKIFAIFWLLICQPIFSASSKFVISKLFQTVDVHLRNSLEEMGQQS